MLETRKSLQFALAPYKHFYVIIVYEMDNATWYKFKPKGNNPIRIYLIDTGFILDLNTYRYDKLRWPSLSVHACIMDSSNFSDRDYCILLLGSEVRWSEEDRVLDENTNKNSD